jgi:hypothetical protein
VSHFKEREEKVCLNCSADLHGKYCHKCGQENREPKMSVWGLITHFFYDITHFDGKFFSTTGQLIARPGRLPKEYIRGRRASFLDPIRMYIFSSAIFFLIFFSVTNLGNFSDDNLPSKQTSKWLERSKEELLKVSETREDSMQVEQDFAEHQRMLKLPVDSTRGEDSGTVKKGNQGRGWNLNLSNVKFDTKEQYDSAQAKLPADQRDNWLERRMMLRTIDLNQRMLKDENQFWKDVLTKFFHTFPYMLFVSLPLYALFLKLLYIRRKKFYYVDHGIFLIFLYIFTFIFLLAFLGVDELSDALKWEWMDFILVFLFFWGIYYAWRAMHKFYGQGRFKTFVKFILFNFMCLISLILLFSLFFLLTVFSV